MMLGSSRTSFDAARDALAARAERDSSDELSSQLLAVSTALAHTPTLRGALADAGTDVEARQALARSAFSSQLGEVTLEVVLDAVGRRWTNAVDLVDAVEGLGFEAAFISAERAGRLDTVEDELFRVERMLANDVPLARTMSDRLVPDDTKAALMRDLLDGQADAYTTRLVGHVVANLRGRRLDAVLNDLVSQSARRRERLLANVKVAAPITDEQERRLEAALTRIYRHTIELQVEVDPEVLGGVAVRIGDEVIDGTVANRLEQARRRLGV